MAIPFLCPTCGVKGKADDKLIGTVARCPKCRSMIKVGEAPPTIKWPQETPPEPFLPPIESPKAVDPPPPPPKPAPTPRSPQAVEPPIKLPPGALAFIAAGLAGSWWLTTMHCSDDHVVGHYLALVVSIAAISFGVATRRRRPWMFWAGVVAAVAVAIAWGQIDYGIQQWQGPLVADDADSPEMSFRDWVRRGESHPYYREVRWDDRGRHTVKLSFSPSGKRHGQELHDILMPDKETQASLIAQGFELELLGASRTKWFWYGEEITEGEWHLRNK